jgi:hypothetical protein
LEEPTGHKRQNHHPEDDFKWTSKAGVRRDGLKAADEDVEADEPNYSEEYTEKN